MTNEIKKDIEVLPIEQDFYIPVELWDGNFIYIGGAYKTKNDAILYSSTQKDKKAKIIKITINIKDFD